MRQERPARPGRLVTLAALTALLACGIGSPPAGSPPVEAGGWSHYGASLAGDRYAAPSAITPEGVEKLSLAWVYRTGDTTNGGGFGGSSSRFQATPILVRDRLIASTGFNRVFALDPATGAEIWTFDPGVDFSRPYSEPFASRGVADWHGPASVADPCRTRVFLGTLDARLIALDADTGAPCADFGEGGEVDLSVGIRGYHERDYSVTSPPAVVGDHIVVGSAVGDNGSAETQPGVVRAYDVRDGSLAWSWDPLPRADDHPGAAGWATATDNRTGGGNVWGVMAADAERDLVFLPTTSPAPDFYGGLRLGDNTFANSVVALRASTGEFVWGYQTVRHDLWDYDLAAQPLLFDHMSEDGVRRPAVAHAGKTGFVFVLDRETGEPLQPVEERAVPPSDIAGEQAARTQPFPKLRLHATDARPLPLLDFNAEHRAACERLLDGIRYDGVFTPPSLEGTLLYPGNGGGTNWGSMAYDRASRIGYLAVNRMPTIVRLIPREQFRAAQRRGTLNGARAQHTSQSGTPYGMARFDLLHNGVPCLEGPWSTLVAVDLDVGEVLWERPLGPAPWGFPTSGGPMVTEGGVVFQASTSDRMLRGYSGADGSELWTRELPAGAHATPMGYRHDGMDYIVVAAGGGLTEGGGRGDHLIAFRMAAEQP